MRSILCALFLLIISASAHSQEIDRNLNITCQDFTWSDVEELVQPYLNEALYAALVMQGQSSEYRTSSAARQAMDNSLPKPVKRMLKALIDAEC